MKAKFSVLPNEISYTTEKMAILAASILISVMEKENVDHINIKTEGQSYISSRKPHQ